MVVEEDPLVVLARMAFNHRRAARERERLERTKPPAPRPRKRSHGPELWLYRVEVDPPDELTELFLEELEWVQSLPCPVGLRVGVDGRPVAPVPDDELPTEETMESLYRDYAAVLGYANPSPWENSHADRVEARVAREASFAMTWRPLKWKPRMPAPWRRAARTAHGMSP